MHVSIRRAAAGAAITRNQHVHPFARLVGRVHGFERWTRRLDDVQPPGARFGVV